MLDIVRVVGAAIFLADLGCKFAYPYSSKFITITVYETYKMFLFGRIAFIFAYHIYRFCIQYIQICA